MDGAKKRSMETHKPHHPADAGNGRGRERPEWQPKEDHDLIPFAQFHMKQ